MRLMRISVVHPYLPVATSTVTSHRYISISFSFLFQIVEARPMCIADGWHWDRIFGDSAQLVGQTVRVE